MKSKCRRNYLKKPVSCECELLMRKIKKFQNKSFFVWLIFFYFGWFLEKKVDKLTIVNVLKLQGNKLFVLAGRQKWHNFGVDIKIGLFVFVITFFEMLIKSICHFPQVWTVFKVTRTMSMSSMSFFSQLWWKMSGKFSNIKEKKLRMMLISKILQKNLRKWCPHVC